MSGLVVSHEARQSLPAKPMGGVRAALLRAKGLAWRRDAAGAGPGRVLARRAEGGAPFEPPSVFLLKRQFDLVENEPFRAGLARGMVMGRLMNMAWLLARISRARNVRETGVLAQEVRGWAEVAGDATDLLTLRGVAGEAGARYYLGLRHGLSEGHGFTRRDRRIGADPVNVVISLLCMFAARQAFAALKSAGLDPRPGVLHDLDDARPALALDLAGEFTPLVADRLALSLFNQGVVGRGDFLPGLAGMFPEWGASPERLTPAALRRVSRAFERRMETPMLTGCGGERMSPRQAMASQARQLRRAMEGDIRLYRPMVLE